MSDQIIFTLTKTQWDELNEILNAPGEVNPKFKALLQSIAPWDEEKCRRCGGDGVWYGNDGQAGPFKCDPCPVEPPEYTDEGYLIMKTDWAGKPIEDPAEGIHDEKYPFYLYAHWTQERLSHIALTKDALLLEGDHTARYVNVDAMIEKLEVMKANIDKFDLAKYYNRDSLNHNAGLDVAINLLKGETNDQST